MSETSGKTLEFFFDFGSPASFLAYTQLPALIEETGAHLRLRPMLLGGVFKATGNASPISVKAKGQWMVGDLQRWAERYGVKFVFNPFFPINTLTLMRGATGLEMRQPDRLRAYCDAVFAALWQERKDMADPAVVAAVLTEAGFDGDTFVSMVADPDIKGALVATTEEAVLRGVFGAPCCFVDGQMHFGQDRLDFVRAALA